MKLVNIINLGLASATTLMYCNDSILNNYNLTSIASCIERSQPNLTVYTLYSAEVKRESHMVFEQGTLRDDGGGNSGEEQLRLISIVQNCYQEHGFHIMVVNALTASEFAEAKEKYDYNIFEYQGSADRPSELMNQVNNGPASSQGFPTREMINTEFYLHHGMPLYQKP